MSTILAIDLLAGEARAVFGETLPEGKVRITSVERFPLPADWQVQSPSLSAAERNGSLGVDESSRDASGAEASESAVLARSGNGDIHDSGPSEIGSPGDARSPGEVGRFAEVDVDAVLALIGTDQVFYSTQELPFDDPKKIEQVAPLQLQDVLPFEVDDFVVDSFVIGRQNGEFRVLSSLAPQSAVAETLATLQLLGADPKLITTRASALLPLSRMLLGLESNSRSDDFLGSSTLVGVLHIEQEHAALLIVRGGEPLLLRDLRWTLGGDTELFRTVGCSIVRAEREHSLSLSRLYVLGAPAMVERAAQKIPRRVTPLDVSQFVLNGTEQPLELEQFSWSLGLLASELQRDQPHLLQRGVKRQPRSLVDFRQGSFAYRRLLRMIGAALQQELFYVLAAVFFGILWIGGEIYSARADLELVESRMKALVAQAMPGESAPYRAEASYIETKVSELEEQLKSMGSLSSLSPLGSLRELVLALGAGIDVTFDTVSIGSSKLTLKGSVADNQSVATLSTLLKARKESFCDVQVDSKGKTGSRVGVTVEIGLCE